ncbi:MAG: NADH-quinone oxidoreductase subunit H [Pyrinomonadaceae bacterium]|nr:NADH-quinone oxidoreductase subunit H [Phycisphaerales bacterium]
MLDNPPSFLTAQLIVSTVVVILVIHVILGMVAYSTYLERKISAYIQDRVGPNRVGFDFGLPFLQKLVRGFGFWGLGQPLADGIKFVLKEDYMPKGADKILFTLAPIVVVIPALIGFAVIPWGGIWMCPDIHIPIINWSIPGGPVHVSGAVINIGIIYLLAVASLGIYGITLGGWASNNKYSFLGALRASSQMLSYEIPMGLALLCVLLITGSLIPYKIIDYQLVHGWLILSQPAAAVIFFICMLAETNRAPFDNAECEQELVGGYHTEYSSMRFALFFLAEYSHMVTSCAFFTLLFLGGYHLPLLAAGHILTPDNTSLLAVLLKFGVYFTKVVLLVCFMMVIRWSLPRMRFDQVMQVAWQSVIPMTLVLTVSTAFMVSRGWTGLLPMLAMNGVFAVVMLIFIPMLPKPAMNRKVRMAGSRFHPVVED